MISKEREDEGLEEHLDEDEEKFFPIGKFRVYKGRRWRCRKILKE